jgi:hypothetical protein
VNWSKSSWGGHQGVSSLPIPTGVVCVVWLETVCITLAVLYSHAAFTCSFCSRSRERYRERDGGGRAQQEAGSLRSSSSRGQEGGSAQAPAPAGPGPTVMLAGSRTFSGANLPTILQPRERAADEDSAWAEDASSNGDPELDGVRPHGPRGSRSSSSRQVAERRERDGTAAGTGRREGKWERKQHP